MKTLVAATMLLLPYIGIVVKLVGMVVLVVGGFMVSKAVGIMAIGAVLFF